MRPAVVSTETDIAPASSFLCRMRPGTELSPGAWFGLLMSTMTLSMPLALGACDRGIAFLGAPAQAATKRRLSGSTVDMVETVSSLIEEMVEDALQAKDAVEFQAVFEEVFPKYAGLCINLGRLVSAMVPRAEIVRLSGESYCELEAEIREQAEAAFGEAMRDRALFTVWTLRKTSDILQNIIDKEPAVSAGEDSQFYGHFLFHALRSRFGVDCLRLSISRELRIYPEVLGMVADSLRSSVDAYAWAKQALTLRAHGEESEELFDVADDEDNELLAESMADLGLQKH